MSRPHAVPVAPLFLVFVMVCSSLVVFAAAPAAASPTSFSVRASGAPTGVAVVAPTGSGSTMPNPAVSYSIYFTESGLPAGLDWQVTVGRATSNYETDGGNDTLVFAEPSGTYSYSIEDISGWHQSTLAYQGSVVVSGASVTEPTLVYAQVTYPVAFSESGLPSGETFQVTLGGGPESILTDGGTDTLTFSVPNGTYSYAISDISGWHQSTLAYHGSVVVSGAGVTETTLAYVQVTYSVEFQENSLPSGVMWQVTVGGVEKSLVTNGATDALSWSGLANGTYSYSVQDISGWHQTTLAYHGNVVVNGASVTEPTLVYAQVTYSVEFSESGLPSGEVFQVTVGRVGESLLTDGGTDSLAFEDGNGTFSYTVTGVAGWHQTTLAYSGSVSVTGLGVTEPTLVFFQVNYTITFTESGLPGGTAWAVTLAGNTVGSTDTTVVFSEPNGTYSYHIDYVAGYASTPASGSKTVAGVALSVSVPFVQVVYDLTFVESTLPHGTSWEVKVDSVPMTSTTGSIAFSLPNGTYDYTIGYVSGWMPTANSGSATISGTSVSVTVSFLQVHYTLTFTETGLPTTGHPKTWTVSLDGVTESSTSASIAFPVANGTHTYLVRGPGGFRVSSVLPPEGTISINGENASQAVTFVRGGTGAVTFHEIGLATGTEWCVTLGAESCSTTSKIISKNLTPGSYSYVINTFHGVSTVVTIDGAAVGTSGGVALAHATTVKVRFAYAVTFTESGLPFDTAWKVSAGGQSVTATTTSIVLYLTNGTYTFHVAKVTGYTATPGSGGVRIEGANLAISVRFAVSVHS